MKPYKSKEERQCMEHLVEAYNLFNEMELTHPSHGLDFTNGIHACQNVLIHRIVQRDYPSEFPTHKDKNKGIK